MKKALLCITVVVMLSGCASLASFATTYMRGMQDTASYEGVRDGLIELCTPENFPAFSARVGVELSGKVCAKAVVTGGAVPWGT